MNPVWPISCGTRWGAGHAWAEMLQQIRRAGFDAVELAMPATARQREEAASWMTPAGLRVSGIVVDLNDPPAVQDAVEGAARLGVTEITLVAGDRKTQQMHELAELVHAVNKITASVKVRLFIANRAGSRLEQPMDFHELFIRLGGLEPGVFVDVLECQRASVNPSDAVAQAGERLSGLAVGDVVGSQRVPLGEGEVNIAAVMGRAKQCGYNGGLVLNPFVRPGSVEADLVAERRRLQVFVDAVRGQ